MMHETCRAYTRREFVKRSAAAIGGLAAASALTQVSCATTGGTAAAAKMPTTTLGRTGVEVSRLAIGGGAWRRDAATPDVIAGVIHRGLELGVNYVDVAPNYGNAEEKAGPTVKEVRDKIFLVTKTEEPTYEGTWQLLRQSLKRLQTDHIDMVHLHNFGQESRFTELDMVFGDKGALGALREAKQQGAIRFIGASGHLYPSRFHAALDTGEFDVLMNAVNYIARHTYDFESKVWSRALREDVGLVAMKVLGGRDENALFRIPEEHYDQAIRYALSVPGCRTACIGLESVERIERAAAVVAKFEPMTEDEQFGLAKTGLELATTEFWRARHGRPLT